MIKYAIWQFNSCSELYRKIIDQIYSPILEKKTGNTIGIGAYLNVEAMEDRDGIPVIDARQLKEAYANGNIQIVLIPIQNFIDHSTLITVMQMCGIPLEDVYLLPRVSRDIVEEQKLEALLRPYLSARYLPYLEFHIADQCNLNCIACEHYSGLVKKPVFPVFEKFNQDLWKLHEYISDIGVIRILGGEPLLNPEIERYLRLTREVYPLADIRVVTNGLLLFSMPESFYCTLREIGGEIYISFYSPLEKRKNELEAFLKEQEVRYVFTSLITEFTKKQVLRKQEDVTGIFWQCHQSHCNNLYDGKVAACFLPFTTKYFNNYFKKDLPIDGAVDLYKEGLTTEELKLALSTPMERCAYCTSPVSVKWGVIGEPSVLSDWVIE